MSFPLSVIDQAFARSDGRCECLREHVGSVEVPYNGERCPETFTRNGGGWEARHVMAESLGGHNSVSNCSILCLTCYTLVQPHALEQGTNS